ncbi:iron ABC transporter permease [Ramlibacter sp. AW1]|uniref:Iron ABC transporter permease n=1 Tax=Ramlibacter aurantiacus TaxID=2801330 RepID=A0A936ZHB0_9BURK|nr:iron ABC transporter permease [Ramlibacter aurantiacus]MBL0419852.1 iron ABC transporter permease [Ramlibacter aurantiacus]
MAATLSLPTSGRAERRPRAGGRLPVLLALALTAATAVVVFYPMLAIGLRALFPAEGSSLELWRQTLASRDLHVAVRNTAILAVATTAISVPLGTFFAWLIERTDAHWGALSRLLPVVPLLLPPVAMAIGWLFLADPRAGFLAKPLVAGFAAIGIELDPSSLAIQSWPGLVFLYVLWAVPHVYVVAAAAFGNIDPSLEEAARMCGKGRLRCFWEVAVPSIRHAVGASVLLCVISSIGLYSIAALMGTAARIDVLSVHIYRLLNFAYPPRIGQAVVIGLLLMLFIGSLWLLQRKLASRAGAATVGGMGVRPNRVALGGWRWPARLLIVGYVVLTSVLPLLALFIVALQPFWRPVIDPGMLSLANFREMAEASMPRMAIANSTLLALATSTGVVMVAGILAILASGLGGALEKAMGVATKLPSAVPHIVFAVGVLIAFGFAPLHLQGGWLILLLAYLAVYLPTATITAESAVRQVGSQLVEASRVFGASPARTFWRVQLPLILPGLAAGWASIFALVLGELNAAAILSGPRNPTIGYMILTLFDNGTYSQLAAIGSLIGVVSAITVSFVLLLGRPRYHASS